MEKSLLLGAFLEIAKKSNQFDSIEDWKQSADDFLKNKEPGNTPLLISFKNEPNKEIKKALKEMKFQWNRFRKEYYGYSNRKTLVLLLNGSDYQIDEIET
jgi:hypothetical protein